MHSVVLLFALSLVFSIPWETAITFGRIGSITQVIGLAAGCGWILLVITRRSFRKIPIFFWASAVFIIWNSLSYFWSPGKEESFLQIRTYMQLFLMAWILYDVVVDERNYKRLLMAYVFGCYVVVASTIRNYLQGITAGEAGRYAGANVNAVEMVVILSLGIPMAWFLALQSRKMKVWEKLRLIIYVGYIPLAVFASILSGSRTALVTILPGLGYVVMSLNRARWAFKILAGIMIPTAIYIIFFLIPPQTINRLITIGESAASMDFGGRGDLWNRSLTIFEEHPLLGLGTGSFKATSSYGEVAHNTFLSVLSEVGVIGFVILSVMLGILVRESLRQSKHTHHCSSMLLMVWILGSLSLTWELTKVTWLAFTIVILASEHYLTPVNVERLTKPNILPSDENEA